MACKTPGATYATDISPMLIEVAVALDTPLKLSEQDAVSIEQRLHVAFENIIADYVERRTRCAKNLCVYGFSDKCSRCGL